MLSGRYMNCSKIASTKQDIRGATVWKNNQQYLDIYRFYISTWVWSSGRASPRTHQASMYRRAFVCAALAAWPAPPSICKPCSFFQLESLLNILFLHRLPYINQHASCLLSLSVPLFCFAFSSQQLFPDIVNHLKVAYFPPPPLEYMLYEYRLSACLGLCLIPNPGRAPVT